MLRLIFTGVTLLYTTYFLQQEPTKPPLLKPTKQEKRVDVSELDHKVLDAVLLDILQDKNFHRMTPKSKKWVEMILSYDVSDRSKAVFELPEKTVPFISHEMRESLEKRGVREYKGSWRNYKPAHKHILVRNIRDLPYPILVNFNKTYPNAIGYIEACLPALIC